jgi:hypothetical protein
MAACMKVGSTPIIEAGSEVCTASKTGREPEVNTHAANDGNYNIDRRLLFCSRRLQVIGARSTTPLEVRRGGLMTLRTVAHMPICRFAVYLWTAPGSADASDETLVKHRGASWTKVSSTHGSVSLAWCAEGLKRRRHEEIQCYLGYACVHAHSFIV